LEIARHPIEAAKAVNRDVNENPKQAFQILGKAEGQVVTTMAITAAVKPVGQVVEGAAARLGQRGGVGVGSSRLFRFVAKSNPSETSVSIIAGESVRLT